ncbi:MAG TPA: hypothetical protein VFB72_13950, partial [Verrucomicrobiae bacterium]|nr:hypothetical protein [Verrucomicrobiae bacterium]
MTIKSNIPFFKTIGCVALAVLLASCRSSLNHRASSRSDNSFGMEKVVVYGRAFLLAKSDQPFHPWGLNYGNHGRLIEDFWDTEWSTLESDFRKMKAMHANVVRVHLQFGKFMDAPDKSNAHALKQFARLVRLAEKTGLYLDITGLGSYRPSDVPAW